MEPPDIIIEICLSYFPLCSLTSLPFVMILEIDSESFERLVVCSSLVGRTLCHQSGLCPGESDALAGDRSFWQVLGKLRSETGGGGWGYPLCYGDRCRYQEWCHQTVEKLV